jgi:hypothetical protein
VVEVFVRQPVGQLLALAPSFVGQDRISGTVGTLDALGQAVAHEQQVHGVGP